MPSVLVLDDELYDLLAQALTRRGFEAVGTYDSDGARELIAARKFDAILLDDIRHDLNSFEAISEWRASGFSGPIIFMPTDDQRGEAAVAAGATSFLTKPFDVATLEQELASQLPPRQGVSKPDSSINLLADRLRTVVRTLRDLRINSIHEEIADLERICLELDMSSSANPPDKSILDKLLPIFERLFDELGSERGAQVIISGAVAGLVSLAGVPALAAYSLTLAVWQGKDAFIAAAKAIASSKDKAD